jgi:hypothetical protein
LVTTQQSVNGTPELLGFIAVNSKLVTPESVTPLKS